MLPPTRSLAAGNPQPYDETAFKAAMAAGSPILVEISAPWCPMCKAQKKVLSEVLLDPKFAGLVFLDVDFDSRKDVVRAFGARTQGTLIVFSGGEEVGRSVGDPTREGIVTLLEKAI
jgi:thioredoxin-like negative regulator of GroEL